MLALAAAPAACGGERAEPEQGFEDRPIAVVVARPERRSVENLFLEREATLLPVSEATLSTRQEGFVLDVIPEVGDVVHAGDLIAQLDPADHELQVREARAAFRSARSQLEVERATWERFQQLHERQVISEGARDEQMAALDKAKSEVEETRARLERAEQNLSELRLTAPTSGVVTELMAESGEYLERGDPVAHLKRFDVMVAVCTVNERFLAEVREGSPAVVHVTAYPGRTFEGLVWKIVGDALVESRSFPVKIVLQNPDLALKPGMSARIGFSRRLEDAVFVAKDAVLDAAGDPYVFVVTDGHAERRPVVLGTAVGAEWHVRGGLDTDDRVVVTGNEDLSAGDGVEVVDLPPPGPPTLPPSRQAERPANAGS